MICFASMTRGFAQEITGRVFNNDSPVAGIIITNKTDNRSVFSNGQGYFKLPAASGDSLVFRSLYFVDKQMVITNTLLREGVVVELISQGIALEEVVVNKELESKKFEPIKYSKDLNVIIREDIKKHPEKYRPPAPNYGVNIAYIFRSLLRWFNTGKKDSLKEKPYLSSEELHQAFQTHKLVNNSFISKQLDIPPERQHLFCQYLELQKLDVALLTPKEELQFLDIIMKNAAQFRSLSSE